MAWALYTVDYCAYDEEEKIWIGSLTAHGHFG